MLNEKIPKSVKKIVVRSIAVGLLAVLVFAGWENSPIIQDAEPPSLETILKNLTAYDFGESEAVLFQLREYVRKHKEFPGNRARIEEMLLAFLVGDASPAAKSAVCRELRLIGGGESVPVLGRMLFQKDTTDMARYALESIPGPEADLALLTGLKQTRGDIRLGIISSLGQRESKAALISLSALLEGRDEATAKAAATALGRIGGPEAGKALTAALLKTRGEIKAAVASSLLLCAESLLGQEKNQDAGRIYESLLNTQLPPAIQQAALKGKIAAAGPNAKPLILKILGELKSGMHRPAIAAIPFVFSAADLQPVLSLVPKLPEAGQVQLMTVLAGYPKEAVLDTIVGAAKSPLPAVRIAALQALEKAGDVSVVGLLADRAATTYGPEKTAARASLWGLKGADVDKAVLAQLESNVSDAVKSELIQAIGERRIFAGKDLLLSLARSSSPACRLQAARQLKALAAPEDIRKLVEVMLALEDETEMEEMQNAVATVARRIARFYSRADVVRDIYGRTEDAKDRASLIRLLGKIGDDSSLPLVRKSLGESDPKIIDAAVRALADWQTVTARDDLIEIVRAYSQEVHKVLALRAYVDLVRLERFRAPEGAVRSLQEIYLLAARPEEKMLVLGELPRFACEEALEFASSLIADDSVKAEAQAAVDRIKERLEEAKKTRLRR